MDEVDRALAELNTKSVAKIFTADSILTIIHYVEVAGQQLRDRLVLLEQQQPCPSLGGSWLGGETSSTHEHSKLMDNQAIYYQQIRRILMPMLSFDASLDRKSSVQIF